MKSWLYLLYDIFWKLCRDLISDLPSSHSPSEHVRILRELCDITVTTGQDAVFEVELSHTGVTNGEWWLGDNLLQNNDLNQMSSQGRVHRLVLKMVTTDESGDVAFVLGEEKSVACLLVEEKPKGKENYMVTGEFYSSHPSPSTTKQLCLGEWKSADTTIFNILTFRRIFRSLYLVSVCFKKKSYQIANKILLLNERDYLTLFLEDGVFLIQFYSLVSLFAFLQT